jgi:hypothetical protein
MVVDWLFGEDLLNSSDRPVPCRLVRVLNTFERFVETEEDAEGSNDVHSCNAQVGREVRILLT